MSNVIERDWTTKAGLRAVCLLAHGSHRCGYVEVSVGHPLHGIGYHQATEALRAVDLGALPLGKKGAILLFTATCDALPGEDIRRSPDVVFDVHGGLTYSGGGDGYPADGDGWWFGFDCAHAGDGQMGRMSEFSDGPVRMEEYVVAECEGLAEQIAAVCGTEALP